MTRRLLAAAALTSALLLTGCDYGEGQAADVTPPEPTTTITVDSSGCYPGSALSHCQ